MNQDGIIYGVSSEGPTFIALDPRSSARATHKLGAALKDPSGMPVEVERLSSPAVSSEVIVVGTLDGRLFGFKPWHSGGKIEQAWTPLGISEEPVLADPILHDGIAYIGTGEGDVFAVDAATGVVRWRAALYRVPPRERPDERVRVELPAGVSGDWIFVAPRGTSSLHVLPR